MDSLDERDVRRLTAMLPAELRDLMQATQGLVIAGGVVRAAVSGEPVSDIDVFAPSADVAVSMATAYQQKFPEKATKKIQTLNAITVLAQHRKAVQFITRWAFVDPRALIGSFDFSVARAAIWRAGNVWASACDPRFYVDLAARRLVFMAPKDNTAGGTLLRVQKFVRRGYRISAFQIAAVVTNLARQAEASDDACHRMERLIKEVDPRSPEWGDDFLPPPAPSADRPSDDDILF